MTTVIFDLDGTISDPAHGIARSINYALFRLGNAIHSERDLHKYIGLHLNVTFSELLKTHDKAILAHAIEIYRERYIAIGYRENRLYEGIRQTLYNLKEDGKTLCIATSKRKDIAVSVIDYLGINDFFNKVHGCDLSRSKTELLRDILADATYSNPIVVMIGDRDLDFIAANEVGIPSIGVRWGYGTEKELSMSTTTVEKPSELPGAIERIAQPPAEPYWREYCPPHS